MNKNEFDYQFRLLDFSVYNKSDNDCASIDEADDAYSDDLQDIQKFEIQMFGINEKGETCSIYVENYKPFFFIRVGNSWTERTKSLFFEEIKELGMSLLTKSLESESFKTMLEEKGSGPDNTGQSQKIEKNKSWDELKKEL